MLFAFSAAVLYAINIPVSKILLQYVPPVFMAAFLYLGAGFGMPLLSLFGKKDAQTQKLTKKELPYTLAMIGLDIAAPIFLMTGLAGAHSANVSLLNNLRQPHLQLYLYSKKRFLLECGLQLCWLAFRACCFLSKEVQACAFLQALSTFWRRAFAGALKTTVPKCSHQKAQSKS